MSSGSDRAWTLDPQEVACRTNLRQAVLRICKFVGQKALVGLGWDPLRISKFMCKDPERIRLARPGEVVALAYLVGLDPEQTFRICIGVTDAHDMELKMPTPQVARRIHENRNWECRPDRSRLVSDILEQVKEKYGNAGRKLFAKRLGIDACRLGVLAKGRCAAFPWVDARIGYYAGQALHDFWELDQVLADSGFIEALSEAHRNYMKWCVDAARRAERDQEGGGAELLLEEGEEVPLPRTEDQDVYQIHELPSAMGIREALLAFGAGVNLILREAHDRRGGHEMFRLHVHPPRMPAKPMFEASLALLEKNYVEKDRGRSIRVLVAGLEDVLPELERKIGPLGHLSVAGIRRRVAETVPVEGLHGQEMQVELQASEIVEIREMLQELVVGGN